MINCWATSLPTLAMTSIIKWRSFTHRSDFSLHRVFRNLSASSFRSESMRRLTLLCNILTHSVRPTAATNQNKPYGNISNTLMYVLQNCYVHVHETKFTYFCRQICGYILSWNWCFSPIFLALNALLVSRKCK